MTLRFFALICSIFSIYVFSIDIKFTDASQEPIPGYYDGIFVLDQGIALTLNEFNENWSEEEQVLEMTQEIKNIIPIDDFALVLPAEERLNDRARLRFKFLDSPSELSNQTLFVKARHTILGHYYKFKVNDIPNRSSLKYKDISGKNWINDLAGVLKKTDSGYYLVGIIRNNFDLKRGEIFWLTKKLGRKLSENLVKLSVGQKIKTDQLAKSPLAFLGKENLPKFQLSLNISSSLKITAVKPKNKVLYGFGGVYLISDTSKSDKKTLYSLHKQNDLSKLSEREIVILDREKKSWSFKLGQIQNRTTTVVRVDKKTIIEKSPVLVNNGGKYELAGFVTSATGNQITIKWIDSEVNKKIAAKQNEPLRVQNENELPEWGVYIYTNFYDHEFSEQEKNIRMQHSYYKSFTRWWTRVSRILNSSKTAQPSLSVAFQFNEYTDWSSRPQAKRGWAKIHGKKRDLYSGAEVYGAGSSANTFADFMKFAIKNCDAKKKLVIFSAHGGTWMGISPEPRKLIEDFSIYQISRAFKDIKVDAVILDSCVMGDVETVVQLAKHADLVGVSQNENYFTTLVVKDYLHEKPERKKVEIFESIPVPFTGLSSLALGDVDNLRNAVKYLSYMHSLTLNYMNKNERKFVQDWQRDNSLSIISSKKANQLIVALDNFGKEIWSAIQSNKGKFYQNYYNLLPSQKMFDKDNAMFDLVAFVQNIKQLYKHNSMQKACNELTEAVKESIIYHYSGVKVLPKGNGLSIQLPTHFLYNTHDEDVLLSRFNKLELAKKAPNWTKLRNFLASGVKK